jgi:hypothetical protein
MSDWFRKFLRGKTATEVDDLMQSRGAGEGESTHPDVVGRRATDESGTDEDAERPPLPRG